MATLALDHARSDFDPFDWKTRIDPYPVYAALRAAGPAVRLDKYDIWAVPRFAEIKTIFADHENSVMPAAPASPTISRPSRGDRRVSFSKSTRRCIPAPARCLPVSCRRGR